MEEDMKVRMALGLLAVGAIFGCSGGGGGGLAAAFRNIFPGAFTAPLNGGKAVDLDVKTDANGNASGFARITDANGNISVAHNVSGTGPIGAATSGAVNLNVGFDGG